MARRSKKSNRRKVTNPNSSAPVASSSDVAPKLGSTGQANTKTALGTGAPADGQQSAHTPQMQEWHIQHHEIDDQCLVQALKPILNTASSIDLCHLSAVVQQMLADPKRIIALRRDLHMGQLVAFMDFTAVGLERRMLTGRIIAMDQTSATVKEEGTRRQWKLPYLAIDLSMNPTPSHASHGFAHTTPSGDNQHQQTPHADATTEYNAASKASLLSREDFKAGDQVSFEDRYLQTHVGIIKRVNQYTATIDIDNIRWRVPFAHLRHLVNL